MQEQIDHLTQKVHELHQTLSQADPLALAEKVGAFYRPRGPQEGTFYVPYWGREITLTFPEFVCRDGRTGLKLGTLDQAILAYYFTLSDGTATGGEWIAFTDLPDGQFYTQAFQSYTGQVLLQTFVDDYEGFAHSATKIRGRAVEFADLAFAFPVVPHVPLLAACWFGDEDFLPSYRILFDAQISHHFSTDACAILGGRLTRRLIRAYNE
jgi:hypothetical protein